MSLKEIVVISGKGGTGKTTVTAAIAQQLGQACYLADCDVDAADLHLIFKPKPVVEQDFYSGQEPEVNTATCIACGKCAQVCRFEAITITDTANIDQFACEGCAYCSHVCPTGAISMQPRLAGSYYQSTISACQGMTHARLLPGGENSGKLVTKVRQGAKANAAKAGVEYILIDGSPGIGCPVVASITGSNYVLLVTEPSLSALHDLTRVVELITKFNLPCGCIINKADLDEELFNKLTSFLNEKAIPCLGTINYTKAVAQAQAAGLPLNSFDKATFGPLFEQITSKLINALKEKK